MVTYLRLHSDAASTTKPTKPTRSDGIYQITQELAQAHRRALIAGKVSKTPIPEGEHEAHGLGVLGNVSDYFPTPIPAKNSREVASDILGTLDTMQRKLDALSEDIDAVYKFPAAVDEDDSFDDRPRAA